MRGPWRDRRPQPPETPGGKARSKGIEHSRNWRIRRSSTCASSRSPAAARPGRSAARFCARCASADELVDGRAGAAAVRPGADVEAAVLRSGLALLGAISISDGWGFQAGEAAIACLPLRR